MLSPSHRTWVNDPHKLMVQESISRTATLRVGARGGGDAALLPLGTARQAQVVAEAFLEPKAADVVVVAARRNRVIAPAHGFLIFAAGIGRGA